MININPTSDGNLRLGDYWDKFKLDMSNASKWMCYGTCGTIPQCLQCCTNKSARTNTHGTLHAYDRYVHLVAAHLSKPISALSIFDVSAAIGAVRHANGYSDGTTTTIISIIHNIFRFAADHRDAIDILKHTHSTTQSNLDLMILLGSDKSEDYIRHALREERERIAHTTKSLTIWQLEKLSSLLWDYIEDDGRCCLICLMLYAGVRPAEGRALRWRDIVPFIDHPDRSLINCYHIRDAQGQLQNRLKTSNAYRRIPSHIELDAYLNKRYKYVQANSDQPIDDYPICCFGNDFSRPCRDFEAAALAQKLLDKLSIYTEDMYAYQIMQLSEYYDAPKTDRDDTQNLTLYVLRRNFWTWLQSNTTLSDVEKRLIMGHELDEPQNRKAENDENLLWDICLKMDHCIISRDKHLPYFAVTPTSGVPVSICNQGVCHIHLTKEMLINGIDLNISVTTEEVGDVISLSSLSPVRQIGNLTPQVYVTGAPPLPTSRGINCDYELWQAHKKPARPHRTKTTNDN